ncbi:MAG: phosphatase PAP2 family protein [Candidatus Obscuribacterales bacterium]|nr:phosphatase PAP2 family protein [Candidatus Obscuribacterales bacterium]
MTPNSPDKRSILVKSLTVGTFLIVSGLLIGLAPERIFDWLDCPALFACRTANNHAVLIGPDWSLSAARNVTALGSVLVLSTVAITITGLLMVSRLFASAAIYAAVSITSLAAMSYAKLFFSRNRPVEIPALDQVSGFSFPSGHAMMSATMYLTLLFLLEEYLTRPQKIYVGFALTFLVLAIGVSRIILGVHYPSDVIAGWLCGFGSAICWRGVIRSNRKSSAISGGGG